AEVHGGQVVAPEVGGARGGGGAGALQALGRLDLDRVVGRKDGCQQRRRHEQEDEPTAEHAEGLTPRGAERVRDRTRPARCGRRRAAVFHRKRLRRAAHPYRIRGSRKPYTRSITRCTAMTPAARNRLMPWMTG